MVLTCSLVEYVGHRVASEDIQSFWQHCFLTAALSERMARGISYPSAGAGLPRRTLARYWGLAPPGGHLDGVARARKYDHLRLRGSEAVDLERERFGTDHCEVGRWIGVSWNFPRLAGSHGESSRSAGRLHKIHIWWVWWPRRDQFCVRRGIVLGGVPPELSEPTGNQGSGHPPGLLAAIKTGRV